MQDHILNAYITMFNYIHEEKEFSPQSSSSHLSLLQEYLTSLSHYITAIVDDESSDSIIVTCGSIIG